MSNFISNETTTLWGRWELNSKRLQNHEAIIHWNAGEEPFRWTFINLINTAKKYSAFIKQAGIKPGEVCAIIIRHNPFFYPLYLGISRTAALPAVLAYPNPRLHPDKFRSGIEGMSQRSGLDYIFTERELDPIIRPLIDQPGNTIKQIYFPLEWNLEEEIDPMIENDIEIQSKNVNDCDPVLLQHSSGTTGLQKPVILSHSSVLQHIASLEKALKLNADDKIVSWLPLYHDMGLIAAFHLPLAYGIPTIQIDPFQWIVAPIIQIEALWHEKATICWLPNFAYNILADKIPEDELEGISLESLRLTINCSEPVRNESHKKFIERFKKYKFDQHAISACYAMAETTFAVTQTEAGKPITELIVNRDSLARGFVELSNNESVSRVCVSSGKLIDGCEIKIVDENRNVLPANRVGEIVVKSISMFDGYRNYPEKTAEVFKNGWYYTGDFGFMHDNEYFIIGRKKDLIIVAGKNVYPEDVEDAVSKVTGVIPGRVIAFGEDDEQLGTEQIAVIAETNTETEKEKNDLRIEIIKAGMAMDVNIHKVYLVPPRWLIKSSAGKPSRKTNKEKLISKVDKLVWSR